MRRMSLKDGGTKRLCNNIWVSSVISKLSCPQGTEYSGHLRLQFAEFTLKLCCNSQWKIRVTYCLTLRETKCHSDFRRSTEGWSEKIEVCNRQSPEFTYWRYETLFILIPERLFKRKPVLSQNSFKCHKTGRFCVVNHLPCEEGANAGDEKSSMVSISYW